MKWFLALFVVSSLSFANPPTDLAQKNADFLKAKRAVVEAQLKKAETDLADLTPGTPGYRRKAEEIDTMKGQLQNIEGAEAKLAKEGPGDTELKSLRDVEKFGGGYLDGPLSAKKKSGLGTSEIDGNDPTIAATLRALLTPIELPSASATIRRSMSLERRSYGKGAYLESIQLPQMEYAEMEYLEYHSDAFREFLHYSGLRNTTALRVIQRFLGGKATLPQVEDLLKERRLEDEKLQRSLDLLEKLRKDPALERHFERLERMKSDK